MVGLEYVVGKDLKFSLVKILKVLKVKMLYVDMAVSGILVFETSFIFAELYALTSLVSLPNWHIVSMLSSYHIFSPGKSTMTKLIVTHPRKNMETSSTEQPLGSREGKHLLCRWGQKPLVFYTVKITDFGLSKVPRESLGKEGCQQGWGSMMMVGLDLGVEDGGGGFRVEGDCVFSVLNCDCGLWWQLSYSSL